jgi:hypothetical protein
LEEEVIKMARYLLVGESNCTDPSREDEFNRWYDNIHIPDLLEIPGMIRATRYENIDPEGNGRAKFLAIYEFESDDIKETQSLMYEYRDRSRRPGHHSELLNVKTNGIYRQIMPTKEANKKGVSING